MKKNKIMTFAASVILAGSMNLAHAQSGASISAEAQQDVQAYLTAVQSKNAKQIAAQEKLILKKYKKDEAALLSMGKYLLDNKHYEEAIFFGNQAFKHNNKSVDAALLSGDAYYEMRNRSEAAGLYEQAKLANENDKRPYFKLVNVYKFIDPELALANMDVIKEKYPEDPSIARAMASIYYHQNDTAKSDSTYKEYFKKVKLEEDAEAAREFAIVQFLKKDYLGSLDIVNKILPQDPKEISLNRLRFYDNLELKNIPEAKKASETFFGQQYADTLYNWSDYKYEGKLQSALNDINKAATAFKKASEMAPEEKKAELLKDLSKAYQDAGKIDEAADTYQKFIELTNPESIVERFNKGRIYYAALEDTSLTEDQKKHYIEAGDALFKEVAEKDDKSYLGPFWRGRINAALDPNNPSENAMAQYTEAVKRLEGRDDSYNRYRVECYRYMSFYYFKNDDYDKSLEFAERVLSINPNDGLATQIKNVLEQLKK